MARLSLLFLYAFVSYFLFFSLVDSQGTPSTLATSTTSSQRVQFTVPASADAGLPVLPNIQDPQAVDAQTVCPGYKASSVVRTSHGFTADLVIAGEACNVYGTDIEFLNLTVEYQSTNRLAINISPKYLDRSNSSQFILDPAVVDKPAVEGGQEDFSADIDLQFAYTTDPFSFTVVRKSTGDVVFDTRGTVLVYENQFWELKSHLPENYNLYGLGERIHGLRLGNNFTATIYAVDVGDPIDTNLYGSHPFYIDTRYYHVDNATGDLTLLTTNETSSEEEYVSYSHGAYLRNAHGMDVLLQPDSITYRVIGGSIDLYFFDGPDAQAVTRQYLTGAVGLPAMQQYWTFGYHQCRWGYQNWTVLQDVIDTFRRFSIPLETVWLDIDYMNQYRDFTNDENSFPLDEAAEFFSTLHAAGQHFVPIIDAAIYIPNPENASDAYGTYTRGNEAQVFLKNPDGSQYIGAVWPGYTVFPDWRAPNGVTWWVDEMVRWHKEIPFDGAWTDMTEVSSFCVGSCGTGNLTLNPVHPPFKLPGEPGAVIYDYPEGFNITNATEAASATSASAAQASATPSETGESTSTSYVRTSPTPGVRNVNYPPYAINHVNRDLAVHAVSPNATHADGVEEYDVHSLYGHQIINATYHALTSIFPNRRPFILGRSTFAGSGKWGAHWGGDNASRFAYMAFSIPQALAFQIFGIPMFGVDTCGFNGNSDEELCNRWMQLSAFFPFYRNHNVLSANPQEPYVWASVAEATRTVMNIRYSLLPYMYTLFHHAHTRGDTVMRALAWEFPNEPALAAADRQFLLGPSLLVTPVLTPQAVTVDGVFPGIAQGEVWYDWYTQAKVNVTAGQNITIQAPLGHIPLYVRGGSILPMQEPGYTTTESRGNPWALFVALSQESSATGDLYLDDGQSIVPNATLFLSFTASNSTIFASGQGQYIDTNPLANITILGVPEGASKVTLNGDDVSCSVAYNETSQVLKITGLEHATSGGAWQADWSLSWS